MYMDFEPDQKHMLSVLKNVRPQRLPIYEHIISPEIMEIVLDKKFTEMEKGNTKDVDFFFKNYCDFFKVMSYDLVSYEVCITETLPGHGAILGGAGPIQNEEDFENYPWDELPNIFWQIAEEKFISIRNNLPAGMKAIGGIGNGVFEISEDLVGFERLAYLKVDNPQLFYKIYEKIGDLMVKIWSRFLKHHGETFAICRFGDDLGFRSGTLVSHTQIRKSVLPQYKRVISLILENNKPFLWHSCGKIFSIMEDVIDLGIQAKHSNEDAIAPFEKWIELYGNRIGLFGGVDVDILCRSDPNYIFQEVYERGRKYREMARGYGLGSGNSIPNYVPIEGYLAMVKAANQIRREECIVP